MMAASKFEAAIGCSVTSAASSGVKHRSRKPPALAAQLAVFRQVASGLAHHPQRRHRLPAAETTRRRF